MKKYFLFDWVIVYWELCNKCVMLQLFWEEYCECNSGGFYSYNYYCWMYCEWFKIILLLMCQVYKVGEKFFVDYCGFIVGVIDFEIGEIRIVQVIVVVFGVLSYIWVEVIWFQQFEDWVMSYVCCFQWLGGVFEFVVSDNLKSVIFRVCKYDFDVNFIYQQMFEYYNVVVLFVWLCKLKDKVKVEVGVQVVECWIMV